MLCGLRFRCAGRAIRWCSTSPGSGARVGDLIFCWSPRTLQSTVNCSASQSREDMVDWAPDLSNNHKPRYLAIADAIAADIGAGRLRVGDRLPPQRKLAERLDVDF